MLKTDVDGLLDFEYVLEFVLLVKLSLTNLLVKLKMGVIGFQDK